MRDLAVALRRTRNRWYRVRAGPSGLRLFEPGRFWWRIIAKVTALYRYTFILSVQGGMSVCSDLYLRALRTPRPLSELNLQHFLRTIWEEHDALTAYQ